MAADQANIELERRDEDPALADFVLSMAKSMNRTGYYSTEHPEGQRALLGLYDGFVNLMHERGQEFAFQLSFSREGANTEDVALYDGKNPIKLMRGILQEGAGNTFVPKFVEYFHRQGLLSFNLRKDLTQPHFEIFVERMTRPADVVADNPGEVLSRDLATAGVRGVSVVFDEDRIAGLRGSIPWRAELALTRLRKDLRMIPMLANATVDEMRKIKSRLMDDILRGIQEPALLIALARHLGEALGGQEEIMPRDEAETHLIEGIAPRIAPGFAERMAKPWTYEDTEDEAPEDRQCRLRLIKALIQRLLSMPEKQAAHALVVLYQSGYIDLDGLSIKARDLIRANALAEAALTSVDGLVAELDHSKAADPFSAVIRDLGLAADVLIERQAWATAAAIVETVRQYAKGQLPVPTGGAEKAFAVLRSIANDEALAAIAAGIIASDGPYDGCVAIARALEPDHAISLLLLALTDTRDPTLQHWIVDEIKRRAWDDAPQIVSRLQDEQTPWFVLKELLIVSRQFGDEGMFSTLVKLYEHNTPQVRSEALISMAAVAPERAARMIERALDDPDRDLRRTASLAAATSSKPSEAVIKRLLRIIDNDREQEGLRLQAASTLRAIANRGPNVPRRREIIDSFRNVVADKYGSRMHRFKRFAKSRLPPPDQLIAAACINLGETLEPDATEDIELLRACLDDENIDIRHAAKHALGRFGGAGRSTAPPPEPAQEPS